MNEELEIMDTSLMKILIEFPSPNKQEDGLLAYRLGAFNGNFVISGQSTRVDKPIARVVAPDASEREKMVTAYEVERDFWIGRTFFELQNFAAVLERIEEVYGVRPARQIDLETNDFEIKAGKDLIAVRMNAVMPHNVALPIITFQLTNQRRAEMDLLNLNGWDLYISPETGEKLMREMQRIKPLVEAELNN